MIRKLKSGWRIYSRKKDPTTGKRRNLGTFATRAAAEKHERDIHYFSGIDPRSNASGGRRRASVAGNVAQ